MLKWKWEEMETLERKGGLVVLFFFQVGFWIVVVMWFCSVPELLTHTLSVSEYSNHRSQHFGTELTLITRSFLFYSRAFFTLRFLWDQQVRLSTAKTLFFCDLRGRLWNSKEHPQDHNHTTYIGGINGSQYIILFSYLNHILYFLNIHTTHQKF
jgi:hypothetical protein